MAMSFDTNHDQPSVDRYVGGQIARKRKAMRLSQSDMAHMLNSSVAEIAQWEAGLKRVSASRLFEIARIFHVAVSYFFEHA